MSEAFAILTSENAARNGGKVNRGKDVKVSYGDTTRKKLSDITNMPQQERDKSLVMPIAAKDYIELLQKENLALKNILADRNKLIELTGMELQKLRLNLQKLQQQNYHLAQSHSQIQHELNSGKDKLKVLQHELGCKIGMLKAKDLEMKEHLKEKEREEIHCKASKAGTNDDKILQNKRTYKPKRFISNGEVQSSDGIENKRPCTRRQSDRFNNRESKPAEDRLKMAALETNNNSTSACLPVQNPDNKDINAPVQAIRNTRPIRQYARFKSQEPESSGDSVNVKGSRVSTPACLSELDPGFAIAYKEARRSSGDSVHVKGGRVSTPASLSELDPRSAIAVQESRRSSVGRPSRHAAMKVQSYKEVPLNVKMRRPV